MIQPSRKNTASGREKSNRRTLSHALPVKGEGFSKKCIRPHFLSLFGIIPIIHINTIDLIDDVPDLRYDGEVWTSGEATGGRTNEGAAWLAGCC
jgi:hypothetical protein